MSMRFMATTVAFFFSVGLLYSMDKNQAAAPQEIPMRTLKLNSQAHITRELNKIYSQGYEDDGDCIDYSSSSDDDVPYVSPTPTQTLSTRKPSLNINS